MLKEKIAGLFKSLDPEIQSIVIGVMNIEQEHISMKRPRVKEDIDAIVTAVASKELSKSKTE